VDRLRDLGVVPGLGTILVGEDPGSVAYVAGKHRDCAEIGAESIRVALPADATQEQVEAAIDQLNADPACTGYIVQLPLPRGIDTNAVLERIDPAKDADGLHPMNLGRLVLRGSGPIDSPLPCTPRAVIELVERPVDGGGQDAQEGDGGEHAGGVHLVALRGQQHSQAFAAHNHLSDDRAGDGQGEPCAQPGVDRRERHGQLHVHEHAQPVRAVEPSGVDDVRVQAPQPQQHGDRDGEKHHERAQDHHRQGAVADPQNKERG